MFDNPSPFVMCSGNNLFRENVVKEEPEDYFSSQLTQSTSLNSHLSVQNSLNESRMSQSILSQSKGLEQSQNKNLEESQEVIVDIDKDKQDINGKKQINIYINSKIFLENPNINIICFKNNNEEKNSNNKSDKNRNRNNNNEMERNRNNNNLRGGSGSESNYMNMINNLKI